MRNFLGELRRWLGEGLEFTLGAPGQGSNTPPPIGVQPYRDKPLKAYF